LEHARGGDGDAPRLPRDPSARDRVVRRRRPRAARRGLRAPALRRARGVGTALRLLPALRGGALGPMIAGDSVLGAFRTRGVSLVTGVPCSYLNGVIGAAIADPDARHLVATSE